MGKEFGTSNPLLVGAFREENQCPGMETVLNMGHRKTIPALVGNQNERLYTALTAGWL